ncbi:cellulase family glycosylhydrolase [Termitidicoccus mucosus]|uniref:Ig-like domain-containing protein n=1 Tax=Termitidicoccus mucosus TaxID=1184151 RepID=A0A178IMV6_9BACT|nr:hypothetical protein AW736_04240 [Opitutaceae bacterium TSB47]
MKTHTPPAALRLFSSLALAAVCLSAPSPAAVFLDTAENLDNWQTEVPSYGAQVGNYFIAEGGEFKILNGYSTYNVFVISKNKFIATETFELSFDGFHGPNTTSSVNSTKYEIGLFEVGGGAAGQKLMFCLSPTGLGNDLDGGTVPGATLIYNGTTINLSGSSYPRPVAASTTYGKAAFKIKYEHLNGKVTITQTAGAYRPVNSKDGAAVPPGGIVIYNGTPGDGAKIDFKDGLAIRIVARTGGNAITGSPMTIDNIRLETDPGVVEPPSWPAAAQRGVNAGNWLTSFTMNDTLIPWGTRLMRLQLLGSSPAFTPELDGISGEWTFPAAGWTAIDNFLDAARSNNMKVVLDFHGGAHFFPDGNYSTWSQEPGAPGIANKNKLVSLWKTIATRYKNERGTIAGYEIFNEPNAGGNPDADKENGVAPLDGADAWNTIVTDVIVAIRTIDSYHAIVIEPVGYANQKYLKRLKYFDPEETPGIIYSVHIYSPHEYAEQGTVNIQPLWKYGFDGIIVNGTAVGSGYYYPGPIDFTTGYANPPTYETIVLDKNYLRERVAPILEFQNTHKEARIFIGEFGAVRHAPINLTGQDSTWTFLRDYLSLFHNENPTVSYPNWDWTIHAFQFSANDLYTGLQYDNNRDSTMRYADTNKIRLYKHYVDPTNDTVTPPAYDDTLPDAAIPATPPPPPYGLAATPLGSGMIDLTWLAASRTEKYKIKYSTTGTSGPFTDLVAIDQPAVETIVSGAYRVGYTDGTVTPLSPGAVYHYRISATNAYGESAPGTVVTATASTLVIPIIDTQPQPQSAEVGVPSTLSVGVRAGTGAQSWQWFKDGEPVASGTASDLVLAGSPADAGVYMVKVTGPDGFAESAPATVTILPSTSGPFGTPAALAAVDSGEIYIADSEKHILHALTAAGAVYTFAGASGTAGVTDDDRLQARFRNPSGLAVRSGTLYIADTGNSALRVSDTGASIKTFISGTAAVLSHPVGLAADTAGTVYIADRDHHQIRKITAGGEVSIVAGSGVSGTANGTGTLAQFNGPAGVALFEAGGANDFLYVADTGNHTVRVVELASGAVDTLAGKAEEPDFADGAGADARFNSPGGLIVDGDGDIYLADTGNSLIRKITPAGVVSIVAGAPGVSGFKDAGGTTSWFNQPRDITLSASGTLYIADTGNRAIRVIGADDKVATLAPVAVASPVPPIPSYTLPTKSQDGGGGAPTPLLPALVALLLLLARRFRLK